MRSSGLAAPGILRKPAAWVNVAVLAWVLRRRGHLALDAQLRRTAPRMLAAGLVMALVLWGLEVAVYQPLAGVPLLRWAGLGVLVGGGMLAYGAAGQALGGFDLRAVAAGLMRRRA